jgi:hypothetical protein
MLIPFSTVTLPKISTYREMKSFTNLLTPFLMAKTVPFYMRFAFSPLKKALADPV